MIKTTLRNTIPTTLDFHMTSTVWCTMVDLRATFVATATGLGLKRMTQECNGWGFLTLKLKLLISLNYYYVQVIGQRTGVSSGDIELVRKLYKCDQAPHYTLPIFNTFPFSTPYSTLPILRSTPSTASPRAGLVNNLQRWWPWGSTWGRWRWLSGWWCYGKQPGKALKRQQFGWRETLKGHLRRFLLLSKFFLSKICCLLCCRFTIFMLSCVTSWYLTKY